MGYMEYLTLMVQYRKNMGELYGQKIKVDEETYWKNRELIKQLRYHALMENIDLYALEFDAKSAIKAEALDEQIKALETKGTALKNEIATEQARIYKELEAGRNPDQTRFKQLQAQQVQNNIDLEAKRADRAAGYDEAEQSTYNVYLKEAYLVKQMVDVRERWERAVTQEEKNKLMQEAEQIRIQVTYLYDTNPSDRNVVANTEDFERRVWLMYSGEDIAPPKFGEPDNRTEEQKEQWAGQKALITAAREKYYAMNTDEQKGLQPLQTDAEIYKEEYGGAGQNMWKERKYETFSGADMTIYFAFPGYRPVDIGTASLVSYSIYREKKQIRTIGAINTKGITKGPRTISGRLVFTVVREHVVEMIKRELPYTRTIKNLLMDELPPFDILVSFGNEYGASAGLVIQGVTLVDEQKTLTVDDLYTENIFTYLARDIEIMKNTSASVSDPYDPLEWYTSSFIPAGSEVLGNFKPEELQVFKSGELLSDPAPFYGAAAGWNAELYDLLYEGETISVPSGSGNTSGGGSNSGGNSGGSSGGSNSVTDPTNDNNVEKWKVYDTEPFLWVNETDNKLKDKNMFVGGFAGQYHKGGKEKGEKINRWATKNRYSGPVKSNYKDLTAEMKKSGSSHDGGNNGDMSVTLKMYERYVIPEELQNNPTNAEKDQEKTVDGFTVLMTWSYFTPEVYKGGVSMINEKPTDKQMSRGTVMGYWKTEFPMSDLTKAVQTKIGGTTAAEKYWLHLFDVSDKRYGFTDGTKKKYVGAIGNPTKLNSKKSKNWGALINISKNGTTIDLKDYLWLVSAIAPKTGERYILDFSDLPVGGQVLVHFQYCPSTPSNPQSSGTEKRHFFIKVTRSKVGDGIGNNGFTNNYDTKNAVHQYRHEKWNRNDYATGK